MRVAVLRDPLGGGPANRLTRAAARLAAALPEPPGGPPSDRAIRGYATALRLALRLDSTQAEELFRRYVDAAKRKMGRGTIFEVRDRTFRPEEVAARLVRHARGVVETFLADRVRERVADLAAGELARVRPEWLSWAEQHHDLRLERPRVVVTIPAYFTNNQKAATRAACRIAGAELVRLIHEPAAACITAARERRLGGTNAVVDRGAGTLDLEPAGRRRERLRRTGGGRGQPLRRVARESVREATVAALDHLGRPGGTLDDDFTETARLTGDLTARMTELRDVTTALVRVRSARIPVPDC
jgi:hypothetical protein